MRRVSLPPLTPLRVTLTGSNVCCCEALGLTARSSSPVIALARALIARGIDPATPLEVYRGSTLALRVRSIGAAAPLTVRGRTFALEGDGKYHAGATGKKNAAASTRLRAVPKNRCLGSASPQPERGSP
jgi:hypothetical protein